MKKKKTKKYPKKDKSLKQKNLFDHLKQINNYKKDNYWKDLSEAEKKTFSTYMINRFLSMCDDFVEVVNLTQQFTVGLLEPEISYKLYMDLIPKNNIFLKYIKGKEKSPYKTELKEYLCMYYEVSEKEAEEYLNLFFMSESGLMELKEILGAYGLDLKKIRQLLILE